MDTKKHPLRPLAFFASLPYFGLPALLFVVSFYGLMPPLIAAGVPGYFAYIISLGLPCLVLLVAAGIAVWREEVPMTRSAVFQRLRLRALTWRQVLGALAVFLLALSVGSAVIGGLTILLIQQGIIPLPALLPNFLRPGAAQTPDALFATIGGQQNGFAFLIAFFFLIVVNVVGEEVWWRGYILPRQELAFGRVTWLVHGLMWDVFHLFKYWELAALLVPTLGIALLATRSRNTTASLVAHGLINGIAIIPIAIGIILTFS